MKSISFHHQLAHRSTSQSETGPVFGFGYETDSKQAQSFGNLYLVADIPDHSVTKDLETKFYKTAGTVFYEAGLSVSFERRFSNLLKSYNSILDDLEIEHAHIWVGVITSSSLCYSLIGQPGGWLLRGGRLTSLVPKTSTPPARFEEITGTRLHAHDLILVMSHLAAQKAPANLASLLEPGKKLDFAEVVAQQFTHDSELGYAALLIESNQPKPQAEAPATPKKSKSKLSALRNRLRSGKADVINVVDKSTKITKDKVMPKVSRSTKQGWTTLWSKYINPYPRRAILIALGIVLGITIIIISIVSAFQSHGDLLTKYERSQSLVEQAQTELNKQNNTVAQSNLDQAGKILQSLSESDIQIIAEAAKKNKKIVEVTKLRNQITNLYDKLANITRVSLAESIELGETQLTAVFPVKNTLFGIDSKGSQIVEINPLHKIPESRLQNPALASLTALTPSYSGEGAYLIAGGKVYAYTPPASLQELKISSLPPTVAIASYLTNLYFLSPAENQVVRFTRTGNSLITKTNMIKNLSGGNLSQATSLVVAGTIFVANGPEVLLSEGGNPRSFKLTGLPEGFGNLQNLSYNPGSQYFAVLNQDRTKLAVLTGSSESASLKHLYALEQNQTIQTYSFSADGKEIYVVTGNRLASFKIEP